MPDVPINREGPQAREPSKCLNRQSYRERLAQKTCLSATRGSKKDSDRAITSATEAVCVPVHLVLPGSPQAKQQHHLHAQLSLGQSCHRQKNKSCILYMQGHFSPVQLFVTLQTLACQDSLSEEGFSRQESWSVYPSREGLPYLSRALYFLLP